MESLRNNAPAILVELDTLGFGPGDTDSDEVRILARRNTDGPIGLRVCLAFGNENTVNNISVYGLDGGVGETIDWHMDITGGTPLAAFLAFMRTL